MSLQVSDDVFILGYPKGLNLQEHFPVWKRGSIASEPVFQVDNSECILIDSATRDGMSGSPVFRYSTHVMKSAAGAMIHTGQPEWNFIGVYSGRYGADELSSIQLAKCWLAHLIDETREGRTLGASVLR